MPPPYSNLPKTQIRRGPPIEDYELEPRLDDNGNVRDQPTGRVQSPPTYEMARTYRGMPVLVSPGTVPFRAGVIRRDPRGLPESQIGLRIPPGDYSAHNDALEAGNLARAGHQPLPRVEPPVPASVVHSRQPVVDSLFPAVPAARTLANWLSTRIARNRQQAAYRAVTDPLVEMHQANPRTSENFRQLAASPPGSPMRGTPGTQPQSVAVPADELAAAEGQFSATPEQVRRGVAERNADLLRMLEVQRIARDPELAARQSLTPAPPPLAPLRPMRAVTSDPSPLLPRPVRSMEDIGIEQAYRRRPESTRAERTQEQLRARARQRGR
jgi:hypothetical protein